MPWVELVDYVVILCCCCACVFRPFFNPELLIYSKTLRVLILRIRENTLEKKGFPCKLSYAVLIFFQKNTLTITLESFVWSIEENDVLTPPTKKWKCCFSWELFRSIYIYIKVIEKEVRWQNVFALKYTWSDH